MKKVISSILCVCLAFLCFAGTKTEVSAAPAESLGASEACAGHTLGTFSGVPACVDSSGNLHVCENNFPDKNFRDYINQQSGGDGYFTLLITAVISGYTEEDYVATCLISIKPVYHVYYISAGEVQLPATQRKLSEKVLALSSYTPVRTGYRFEGWSTEPNDTTVEYQPGDTYTEDADLTLYAVWKWTPKCSACDGTGQKRVSCQECDGDGYTTVKTSRTCTICSGKGTVKQTYTVKEEHTCSICHGELVTWSDSLQGWVPCRGCNGLGTVTVEVEKEKNVTCSTCNGLGKIYSTSTKTCSTCLGVGYKKVRCTQCGGDGICTQDSFGVSYDPNGGTGAPASQTKEKASS